MALLLFAAGCAQTRYVEMQGETAKDGALPALARRVEFRLDDQLLTRPLACLLVVGTGRDRIAPELAELIEQSLTRHLLQRSKRVIAGIQRDQQARYHGIAAIDRRNARLLADRLRCDGLVEYDVADAESHYLVFYTRLSMKFDVRTVRLADGAELWHARHAGARSVGGPPTSLASIVSVWSATELASDDEAAATLVEEIVRRMMATWPIAKHPA